MLQLDLYLKNYWETQLDEFPYVNYERHFTEAEPCNIYLIGIRNRVTIDPSYSSIDGKKLKLRFQVQDGFDFKEIFADLELEREVVGELVIESWKPFSRFNLRDDIGHFFDKVHHSDAPRAAGKSFYALRQTGYLDYQQVNDLELLYIGKSLKMDKAISPVKRIQNHKKVQQILLQCTQHYFDKEVYVLLCSFVHKINLVAHSDELVGKGSWKDIQAKLRKDIQQMEATQDLLTQITEAALIDYFDTREFNQDFIGAFGRKTHSYYPRVQKAGLTEIMIEVDLRDLCRVFSTQVAAKYHHVFSYYPLKAYERYIHPSSL